MVKSINVSVDDEVHEKATEVKEQLGLTWEQYIKEANELLQERS